MNCEVARTPGLGRQFGDGELTCLAVEPRDIDTLALAVGEPRKGRRIGAPVGEELFFGCRNALCQKPCCCGSVEKCTSSHCSFHDSSFVRMHASPGGTSSRQSVPREMATAAP